MNKKEIIFESELFNEDYVNGIVKDLEKKELDSLFEVILYKLVPNKNLLTTKIDTTFNLDKLDATQSRTLLNLITIKLTKGIMGV